MQIIKNLKTTTLQATGAHGITTAAYGVTYDTPPDTIIVQSHNTGNSNQAVVTYNIMSIGASSVQLAYAFAWSSAANSNVDIRVDLILIWD